MRLLINKTTMTVVSSIAILLSIPSLAEAKGGLKNNNDASVSCSIGNLSGSVNCLGAFGGNDSNSDLQGSFGISDWEETLKLDSNAGSVSGNGINLNVGGNATSGTFSLNGLDSNSNYMVALKGGPSYSLYDLDRGNTNLAGNWNTQGIFKGNGQAKPGLSHFTVYRGNSEAVPEPTTLFGVAVAGGLGVWLKKKKDQA